jgi:hypothetical protein
MSDNISAAGRLDRNSLIKAMLIFGVAFVAYFLSRSPGLDEYDSVQFAMGVRDFNLWEHQPHPPGYPLFIFFGWIGGKVFGASPEDSLHFVSSLGGALFVAAWFFIIRLQFNQRLAWWVAACLAITPVVWMTSTKVLTDSLAAGFLSAEIAAAIWFWQRGRGVALCAVCLFGAAAAGTRPQLIAVVFLILFLALRKGAVQMKMSIFAAGALIAGCLLWLVPMWHSQVGLRDNISPWLVYPQQVYGQWHWLLNKPHTYLFAGDWSPGYLAFRFVSHILGWFGLGFGFLQSWAALFAGGLIVTFGFAAYLFGRREPNDRQFWRFHLSWALLHIAIIFVCLPANQRYYLVIYPLLLVACLRGFLRLPAPWNWSALALPAILLFITVPLAITNHWEEAPPIRLMHYPEKLYPSSTRHQAVLLFDMERRHAKWYDPEFTIINPILLPNALPAATKDAIAVYTDSEEFLLPKGWRRVPLVEFRRSWVIHMKHHVVRLFLIDRGDSS